MSLLIKALDKAEKAQEEQSKTRKTHRRRASNIANSDGFEAEVELDLQLEGKPEHNLTQEFYATQYTSSVNDRAANVFEAKQLPTSSGSPLLWIAALALLGLMAIGGYFYYQLNHVQPAPIVAPSQPTSLPIAQKPTSDTPSTQPSALPEVATTALQPEPTVSADIVADVATQADAPVQTSVFEPVLAKQDVPATRKSPTKVMALATGEQKVESQVALSMAPIASESVSIQIAKSKAAPTVNPTLMSAYNAYLAGQDAEAQTLYKKVLQQDVRNVDALLGLAVIAERQGRLVDATAWYKKVLDVEPRNVTALASIYSSQQLVDDSALSKLKNLVAKEPNNASLHAELGSIYAEQALWPEAQQAYFEAYRLNPSAENAFNLAIGLDQMGKAKLALPYYLEAQALSQRQPHHSIDEITLQQRIQTIQSQ